jgi:hypothetical protein
MTTENDAIDLNKLSHRDLLLLLHSDVKELKTGMEKVRDKQSNTELKVNSLETKSTIGGSIGGFLAGFAITLIDKFITR